MMIDGQIKEDNLEIEHCLNHLAQITEKEFIAKLNYVSENATKQMIDRKIQNLFNYLCYKDEEDIRKYLNTGGLSTNKMTLFLKQFELWKENESSLKNVEIHDREQLLDLHWKLVVRSGGDLPTGESTMLVQFVLVVEKNEKLKKHHLEVDVQTFYDFLHKLNNSNESLQELLRR